MAAAGNKENAGNEEMLYYYLGDRNTRPELKQAVCCAVRNAAGKCIRGRNGAMLVSFNGEKVVVLGRRLRKRTAVNGHDYR